MEKLNILEQSVEEFTDGMPAVPPINGADAVLVENGTADGDAAAELSDSVTLGTIRKEGNQLFRKKDWDGAVEKYSQCITQALSKLDGSANTNIRQELMLAYSNRAEARLRLQHYDDALIDADEALKIEPLHVKTLVRKGKAAHELQLFEKACEALRAACRESPKDHSITENLNASVIALKQSSTGEYDITWFPSCEEEDNNPAFADFIGPVEIRRAVSGRRGLGLFATRDVKAGELLLVSNPIVYGGNNTILNPAWEYSARQRAQVDADVRRRLILKLSKRIKTSKRHMAQLRSLWNNGKDEMVIPSMELFRPGSEWVPEDLSTFETDIDGLISDFANANVHRTVDDVVYLDGLSNRVTEGIWMLPSVMNHSCAPNVTGDCALRQTYFYRASFDIMEGEELLNCCYDNSYLFEYVDFRRRTATRPGIADACKCARCCLDESLRPKLSNIMKVYPDLKQSYTVEAPVLPRQLRRQQDLANLADEIEVVLQSERSELGPNGPSWIRASFLPAYHSKYRHENKNGDLQSQTAALRLLLDSISAVSFGRTAVLMGKGLFWEVGMRFPESSETYREMLDRVLMIYRTYFGDLGKETFMKSLRATAGGAKVQFAVGGRGTRLCPTKDECVKSLEGRCEVIHPFV